MLKIRKIIIGVIVITAVIVIYYQSEAIIYRRTDTESIWFNLIYTAVVTILIFILNTQTWIFLNKKFPWSKNVITRLTLEFILTSFNATLVICLVFLYSQTRVEYINDWGPLLFENIVVTNIVNIIVCSIIEGAHFLKAWKESLIKSERLEKENIRAQYETLKNQVNPHFLFNSLNSLSSLIQTDKEKAEIFIEEFSKVYRYVLEVKDKSIVPLRDEMDFLNSYIFLQKIRFGENLNFKMDIRSGSFNKYLPPVSLQILAENALKHNIVSFEKPLSIYIYDEGDYLVMNNNMQKRYDKESSTGIGLPNLKEKYKILSDIQPEFYREGDLFCAKLPLIIA